MLKIGEEFQRNSHRHQMGGAGDFQLNCVIATGL